MDKISEVEFLLFVMKNEWVVKTSTGFEFPEDRIWGKLNEFDDGKKLISSNELFELFEKEIYERTYNTVFNKR
jgi:hypothetical protein